MMKFSQSILLALFLVVAAFAIHDIVPEEDPTVPEEIVANDEHYEKAKAHAAKLLQSGKTRPECRNAANDMKKQVRASVKAQQDVLNGMPRGAKCGSAGLNGVRVAQRRLKTAKRSLKKEQTALTKARDKSLNFGNFKYKQLTEGKCGSFFNQGVWKRAKAAVLAAKKKVAKAAATVKAAKQAVEDAIKEAKRLKKKCECRVRLALEKALRTMNSKAKKSNTEAWTKSTHLLCVLQGKKNLNNCRVSQIPRVKQVKFTKELKTACRQRFYSVGSDRVKNAAGRMVKFTLVRMKASRGWGKSRSTTMKNKYIKMCKDEGMVPVGCGAQSSSSYDCRRYQGASNCMALPGRFSCNTISGMSQNTKGKLTGRLLGYFTNGNYHAYSFFYTGGPAGAPTPNALYHPICGKYGTPTEH